MTVSKRMRERLDDHARWLNSDKGKRLNLDGLTINGADLQGEDLRFAFMRRTRLINVNLIGADLRFVEGRMVRIINSQLVAASLSNADLSSASLNGSDLLDATLVNTNLANATLKFANLDKAIMHGSTLKRADLTGAHVSRCSHFLTASFDPRGYELKMWREPDGEIWVSSGCRSWAIENGLAHWGNPLYMDRDRGEKYVRFISFLKGELDDR